MKNARIKRSTFSHMNDFGNIIQLMEMMSFVNIFYNDDDFRFGFFFFCFLQ